jgi:hypothetical protein
VGGSLEGRGLVGGLSKVFGLIAREKQVFSQILGKTAKKFEFSSGN